MSPTRRTAAIYLRVSTEDQNLDNQRIQLEAMAVARGLEIVAVYEEKVSGTKDVRPAYDKMMKDGHKAKWSCLLVVALDRLGRSMMRTISAVLALDKSGVEIISLREPWLDTGSGPIRELLLCIFSWVAAEERRVLISRTRAGLARCKSKGMRLGRPVVRVDLPRALQLRDDGLSIREVAKALGLKPSTIHRALTAADASQKGSLAGGGPSA